jgi:hypothetical protein
MSVTLRTGSAYSECQIFVAYDEVTLDAVLQLAQIARPVIRLPRLDDRRRKLPRRKAIVPGKPMHEMARQQGQLVLAIPKAGHVDCVSA